MRTTSSTHFEADLEDKAKKHVILTLGQVVKCTVFSTPTVQLSENVRTRATVLVYGN